MFMCGFFFAYSKIAQYEQDLKYLHHEIRSKEVFLTKVNIIYHFVLEKLLNLKKNSKLLVTI